jgi:RNA polymerase sigma factor (sigma-70 family)
MGVNHASNGHEPTDAALLRRFLDGDEAAFRTLYRRHTPRLRMVVLRLLAFRDADADDVVQETWLAGCRALRDFRGDSAFGTWITTIGVRRAQRRLEINDRAPDAIADDSAHAAVPDIGEAVDIERALSRLPDQHRAVVVLHDIEGFTHEEIADQLGFAVGTSKATLSRARVALRRYWNGDGKHD